jgi:hypothetical protein
LSPIDYFLRDISRGMARIQNGEVPDGSGNQIVPTDGPFLFKPGLAGGQIAHGGANSGEQLELHSNTAFDGLILLGSSSAYDEANGRLGIGDTTPLAVLHLAQPSSTPLLAASDVNLGTGPDWGLTPAGTATANLQTNDAGTSVVFINNLAPNTTELQLQMPPLDSAITTWTVRVWGRQSDEFAPGGLANGATMLVRLTNAASAANSYTSATILAFDSVPISASYSAFDFVISTASTPTAAMPGISQLGLNFISPGSYQITWRITLIEVFAGTPGGASDLTHWYTQAGSVLTSWVDESAVFHAPQYNLVDASGDEGALVPAVLSADRTWTFPNGTGTVGLLSGVSPQTWSGAINVWEDSPGASHKITHSPSDINYSVKAENASGDIIFSVGTADDSYNIGGGINLWEGPVGVNQKGTFATILTADRVWTMPDLQGTVALISGAQTLTTKTINTSTLGVTTEGNSDTASSGFAFQDVNTTTKQLRMILSGAVGNNTLTFTNTAARNFGHGNLSGNVVVVGDDPPAVASGSLGKVDLTAQVANIGTTALSSTPPAGLYAVEVYIATTTADVTAGTLAVVIGWTDVVGATTANAVAAHTLAATGRSTGRQLCQVASGDITYAVTITGGYGTSAFAVYLRVVALG